MTATDSIQAAVQAMRRGGIVAYPTEGVWGLGCDPYNEAAVGTLLALKDRALDKGLILLAASLGQLKPLVDELPPELRETLAAACPGPDTWLIPDPHQTVPAWIRGKFDTVAVRVSEHPVAGKLAAAFGGPIVSTSANPADSDPALTERQVLRYFPDRLDFVIAGELGGRDGPSRIVELATGKVMRD